MAASLPKYLMAGGIILGVLILAGLLSWWWKRRKRRARFFDDDEDDDEIWAAPRHFRRISEDSEASHGSGTEKGTARVSVGMKKLEGTKRTGRTGRRIEADERVGGEAGGVETQLPRPSENIYSLDARRMRDRRTESEEALISHEPG